MEHRIDEALFEAPLPLVPAAGAALVNELRPKTFDDYPGQDRVVDNLKIYTEAARIRGKMLDHCLLYGPPGLGKTTLAGIVAFSLGCPLKVTTGPAIERPADLMGVLASLEERTVLFIDEIHRLPAPVEEILYTALEDRRLDFLVGKGAQARSVSMSLPEFTMIGATTRPGAISAPLRSRFGIVEGLEFYPAAALAQIIERSARLLGGTLAPQAALLLAERCRGTPRVANTLLARVLDFALVHRKEVVDPEIVEESLARLGIDLRGLSRLDREFLRVLRDRFDGGPAGMDAVAAALNHERTTLEDMLEPYLVWQGYVLRTQRGRVLAELGSSHLEATEARFGVSF